MPLSSGPNNSNLGLVFTYDTGDTVNSYIGEPLVNCATDLSSGYNVTVTEITDGSITPPFPGMRVYKFVTANDYNLHRQGGYYNGGGFGGSNPHPLILGTTTPSNFTTVGTGKYRFGMYIRGEVTNQVGDGVTIDIGDRNQVGTTVGTNTNWQLLQTDDALGIADSNYPYDFFDIGASFNMTFYVAGYGIWRSPGTVTNLHFIQAYPIGNQYLPYGQSRSFTQGLLSLTGSTIDLSNVSFNSNAQVAFDGTNDRILLDPVLAAGAGQYTIEAIFKANSIKTQVVWEQNSSTVIQNERACMLLLDNGLGGFNGQANDYHSVIPYTTGVWYHWVIVVDKFRTTNTIKLYNNGTLYSEGNPSNGAVNLNVGNYASAVGYKLNANSEYFDGQIPIVRVYNRCLTPSEIKENYNGYKIRFNLA
jgi:hypothetical protein